MKVAELFLNLPELRLQAAADDGVAKAEAVLAEHLSNPDGADEDNEALPDTESDTESDDTEIDVNNKDGTATKPKIGGDDTEDIRDREEDNTEGGRGGGWVDQRLWKRIVSPLDVAKAPAASEAPVDTETDDEVSDDADAPPANAAGFATPAAVPEDKKVMSEGQLLSKIEPCVQSCMLNRAREVTPEDMNDRRANIEAVLRK
ncbi:hypothetical protein BGZ47_006616 [Haplosporangium gracile]|nr:hypothetical protein BGZ47_006616 [Haplosporangium gracile]